MLSSLNVPGVYNPDLSTIANVAVPPASVDVTTFTVVVVSGPDVGQALTVGGAGASRAFVGQSQGCALVLRDRRASRRHLALEANSRGLKLTDLGSTNGTLVNGVWTVEAVLRGGETISIGETILRVDRLPDVRGLPLSLEANFGRLIGSSVAMRRLYPVLNRLAASDVPIIIEGETGTGKEVLAEALHELGARARGPFVVFDCTTVAPNLLEAALFGHERGAFTGAVETRIGVFEEADGGTLLIDEIGDLDVALQAKLLRALERSEVRRIGGHGWMRVDVRVLAATRRNLEQLIQEGRFRDDLFFRLAVGRVELPALRDRDGDVVLLAEHFWTKLTRGQSTLPRDFSERLSGYHWPGNVRELQNAVARRHALGGLDGRADDLVASGRPPISASQSEIESVLDMNLPLTSARERLVDEFERRYVARVLERYGGNVAQAAAASGIARRYFNLLRARHSK